MKFLKVKGELEDYFKGKILEMDIPVYVINDQISHIEDLENAKIPKKYLKSKEYKNRMKEWKNEIKDRGYKSVINTKHEYAFNSSRKVEDILRELENE